MDISRKGIVFASVDNIFSGYQSVLSPSHLCAIYIISFVKRKLTLIKSQIFKNVIIVFKFFFIKTNHGNENEKIHAPKPMCTSINDNHNK